MKKIILVLLILISPVSIMQNIAETRKDEPVGLSQRNEKLGASKIASEKEVFTKLKQ